MPKVIAGITTSVDGYITGPDDGPGKGLGEGGERLHYWVFGGPWSYEEEARGEVTGEDAAYLEDAMSRVGAVVAGRATYESARHWGDENPWDIPYSSSPIGPRSSRTAASSPSCRESRRRSTAPARRPARRQSTSWAEPT
jgi:dihydrofolate reductase